MNVISLIIYGIKRDLHPTTGTVAMNKAKLQKLHEFVDANWLVGESPCRLMSKIDDQYWGFIIDRWVYLDKKLDSSTTIIIRRSK